jgi:large subunit ribosomal protein L13
LEVKSLETQWRTFQAKEIDVDKKWYIIDASGKTLGKLAAEAAKVLRGKNKPIFTRHVDTGDFVVVINADKVTVTGKRFEQKSYFHYSGYPGGAKVKFFKDLIHTNPVFIIEHSIKGMLPHNRLGNRIFKKLKVYAGNEHPHSAQKPEIINI